MFERVLSTTLKNPTYCLCGGMSEEALGCVEKIFVAYCDSNKAFIFSLSKHTFKIETLRLSVCKEKTFNRSSAVNNLIEFLKYQFYITLEKETVTRNFLRRICSEKFGAW